MRNEVYADELKVISIEMTIQLGHVTRMGEERLPRKVYETKRQKGKTEKDVKNFIEKYTKQKKTEKEKGKGEKNMDGRNERGIHMKQEKKTGRTQGKCEKTEKSGNNYGGNSTSLHLHLTITWVLGLS